MFQEKQRSGFLSIKIDIKFYTNNKLDKVENVNGLLDINKKVIKYTKNDEEVLINFKNTPIIKKEDNEKKIIISKEKIKVFIKDNGYDIILPIKDYKYTIDNNKIRIMYHIEDSKENKMIKIDIRRNKDAK